MTGRLRIAQIAPLAERVPPLKYGGTERVVAALTNELVRRGHDVTLFATGDSDTLATLVPLVPSGLRLMPGIEMPRDIHPPQMVQLGHGLRACGGVRRHPQPRRLLHLPVHPPRADARADDDARAARSADPAAHFRRLPGCRRQLDQPASAAPAAAGPLDRQCLQRHRSPASPCRGWRRRLLRLPRANLAA